jgi:nucleoid-associated protein YgaU
MDREALAANALRADVEEIEIFAGAVQDLEAVLAVVRAKQTDLKDTQARLKDQTKLCLEEIGLGSRWRRKLPPDESTSSPVFDATPVGGSDARPLVVSESSSVEDLLDAALARTQSAETPPHERSELPDQVFDAALEELDAAPLETPAEQLERAPAAISESDLNQLLGALEDAP